MSEATMSGSNGQFRASATTWNSLDERARTLLRPLIDAGVLVTYRDRESKQVMVTFAGSSIPQTSDTLLGFLHSNRDFLEWRQRLQARASLWHLAGRVPELLLNQDDSRRAQRWRGDHEGDLSAVEQAYLEESAKRRSAEVTGETPLIRPSLPIAEAGEFTRMFQRPPLPTSAMPQVPPPPPSGPPSNPPGEFTAMFSTSPGAAPGRVQTYGSIPVPVTAEASSSPVEAVPTQAAAPMPSHPRSVTAALLIAAAALMGAILFLAAAALIAPRMWRAAAPPQTAPGVDAPSARAQAAINAGNYEQAIDILSAAINRGQPLYADRAYAHRLVGNLDAALADYAQAIRNGNATAQTYADQAYVFTLMKDNPKAIESLTQAIHMDPSKSRYYVDRGNLYVAEGKPSLGLTDFEYALRLDETSPAAQTGRARALSGLKLPLTGKDLPPRVYIQISSEVQRADARRLQDHLSDLGYVVTPPTIAGQSRLAQNELRYYAAEERPQAERLAVDLQTAGFPVKVVYVEKAAGVRPDHFEIRFANKPRY